EYIYRIPSPHAWYFLALRDLTFTPEHPSFTPGTPVGLVLRELSETRRAIASRAEPAEVIRDRLNGMGTVLLEHAGYAYRDTDWVIRLERTGRRLAALSRRVAPTSYSSIAAGTPTPEWVEAEVADDLVNALSLLEDEWDAFG